MRQKNTKRMLEYWLELYWQVGNQPGEASTLNWPSRNDIQPAECRSILPNMFILERNGADAVYRLAGTNLCSLYGRELKQERFQDAFVRDDQRSAESWVYRLGLDDYLVLICSQGKNVHGECVNIETLLLPLLHNDKAGERILGVTSACEAPEWLGSSPILSQAIRSVRILRPWESGHNSFQPLDVQPAQPAPSFADDSGPIPPMFTLQDPLPGAGHAGNVPASIRRVKHLRIIDGGLS